MAKLDFDASSVIPQDNFDVLPAGWYSLQITATETKAAKSGNGEYLQIEYTVDGPDYAGRKVWDRLNLWNVNTTAVEIAEKTLAGICHSLELGKIADSDELLGHHLDAKISIRKSPEYGDSNEIKAYRAGQARVAPAGPTGPVAKASTGAPWQR